MVEEEVKRAMITYDADQSGALSFTEFVVMVAKSPDFKFKLTEEEKQGMMGTSRSYRDG